MRVLFFSSENLGDCEYFKEGSRNLLKTRFGVFDTIAFCGRLEDAKRTKYGVMFTLNDGNIFNVTAGTFNESVLKDSEKILGEFNKKNGIYLLVYANPFFKSGLYMNANQDNSVIVVDESYFIRFHELRKEAEKYLEKKSGGISYEKEDAEIHIAENEEDLLKKRDFFSEDELIKFIGKFSREKPCRIDEIGKMLAREETPLKNVLFEKIEEKIYSLIESGVFYEPVPGYVKIVD